MEKSRSEFPMVQTGLMACSSYLLYSSLARCPHFLDHSQTVPLMQNAISHSKNTPPSCHLLYVPLWRSTSKLRHFVRPQEMAERSLQGVTHSIALRHNDHVKGSSDDHGKALLHRGCHSQYTSLLCHVFKLTRFISSFHTQMLAAM